MKKRRTYGYTHGPVRRNSRSYGDQQKAPTSTHQTKNHQKGSFNWSRLFIFPFKLLGWFIGLLWGGWKKRPKLKKRTKKILRQKLGWIVITLAVFGFLGGTIMIAWASKDLPDPDRLTDRRVDQSTKIFDRTGEHLLYEIFADEKRTLVEFDEIPQQLIDALIATEDTKFYEHNGIRPLSMVRSVIYGVLGKGRIGGGASTLTQQLVKNAILTNERKMSRKIKEIILSIRLEQKYTKDQILKIYFNEIPYGSTNYGVEAASQSYFGKTVSDLDLQESATLAGLPKAPSRYLRNSDALLERRNFVLRRMFEEGFITEQTMRETQTLPTTLERRITNIEAPHFALYVRGQLADMFDEKAVDTGGLKVITTLDWDKQQIAEQAVARASTSTLVEANANNAALVSMDPNTGEVLALVGSADFFNEEINGQFNVALDGRRQPGSSFKPIIYTAAFEKGYTPDTVLFDVKTNFSIDNNNPYEPLNYNLKELGPVSMRQAIQGSLNIPAVKALYLVGDTKGVGFAQRLGYTTLGDGDFGLSLVLGGGEVILLDHVRAYSVFANGGLRHEPVTILEVEDSTGDILFEWKKKRGERVLEEDITATISNVLSDDEARTYAFGAGGVLTLPDRPVAAKTGTTNAYVDGWTIGYTPSLVTGVWVGNTDNSPMKPGFGGGKVAGPIWKQYMSKALAGTAVEVFPTPPPNEATKPVLRGSAGGGITLKIDKVTGKIATTSTPPAYIVERTYTQPHSILHYVNKDDPRGPEPENPSDDPQYQIWEDAIQDWARRKKEENPDWDIVFEEPPTAYDDIHSLELIPSLVVVIPTPSSTLTSRLIDTDIRVTSPRGVSKVTYRIDEKYVGVIRQHPFNLNYTANGLTPGNHTLTIIVEDDVGNRVEQSIPFILDVAEEPPSVSWEQSSIKIDQSSFPKTLFLNHYKLSEIDSVTIYGSHDNGPRQHLETIEDFLSLFDKKIQFQWNSSPAKGNWELTAESVSNGNKEANQALSVTIQ